MSIAKKLAIFNVLFGIAVAVIYFATGDTRRALYWFFGACITATVTF